MEDLIYEHDFIIMQLTPFYWLMDILLWGIFLIIINGHILNLQQH